MHLKNIFFKAARNKAIKMLVKPGRLLLLLTQLTAKLRHVDWKMVGGSQARENFFILGRLTKAYSLGDYKVMPWKSIISIIAALIYFVSPIDLIPDFIPLIGLSDDLSVLLWVYNSAKKDINNFLAWEKSQTLNRAM